MPRKPKVGRDDDFSNPRDWIKERQRLEGENAKLRGQLKDLYYKPDGGVNKYGRPSLTPRANPDRVSIDKNVAQQKFNTNMMGQIDKWLKSLKK